eukprot:PhM_4_TR4962/c0_g1_i1/m.26930
MSRLFHNPNRPRFMVRSAGMSWFEKRLKPHGSHFPWWRSRWNTLPPAGIIRYTETPRILLDRDLFEQPIWQRSINFPDSSRWERIINGERVTEDRHAYVEEDGEVIAVPWKAYNERINRELEDSVQSTPEYTQILEGCPVNWKKLEFALAVCRGLSLREAKVQMKLLGQKPHHIVHRLLELAETNAVNNKGLNRDKLRIARITCWKGREDAGVNIRSRGYFSWKTKHASTVLVVVAEDPEMVLPDRTRLPWWVEERLRRHGIATSETELDVPAITAEGI